MDFKALTKINKQLEDSFALWGFGGGWAIDGVVGQVTRTHEDVDICILREDLDEWRETWADSEWFKVVDGKDVPLAEGETPELPVHELRVRKGEDEREVLLLETDGDDWVYRRDPRVKMPVEEVFVAGVERMPFLNPVIALLFKSDKMRGKDVQDFKAVLPFLTAPDKEWLLQALQTVYGTHVWMDALKGN